MDTLNSFNNIANSLKGKVYNSEEDSKKQITDLVFILENGGCSVDVTAGKLTVEKDGNKLNLEVNRRNDGKITLNTEVIPA